MEHNGITKAKYLRNTRCKLNKIGSDSYKKVGHLLQAARSFQMRLLDSALSQAAAAQQELLAAHEG